MVWSFSMLHQRGSLSSTLRRAEKQKVESEKKLPSRANGGVEEKMTAGGASCLGNLVVNVDVGIILEE